jgi:hypothetical protein
MFLMVAATANYSGENLFEDRVTKKQDLKWETRLRIAHLGCWEHSIKVRLTGGHRGGFDLNSRHPGIDCDDFSPITPDQFRADLKAPLDAQPRASRSSEAVIDVKFQDERVTVN